MSHAGDMVGGPGFGLQFCANSFFNQSLNISHFVVIMTWGEGIVEVAEISIVSNAV